MDLPHVALIAAIAGPCIAGLLHFERRLSRVEAKLDLIIGRMPCMVEDET